MFYIDLYKKSWGSTSYKFGQQFCNHLAWEDRADFLTLILVVLLLSSCWCSVSTPHGSLGWSAVCDCHISLSYSLTLHSRSVEVTAESVYHKC